MNTNISQSINLNFLHSNFDNKATIPQNASQCTLWQNRHIQKANQETLLNTFNLLPDEIIQNCIAPYLTPNEALSLRLVDRRFTTLFGDNYIWRTYYHASGLVPPATPNLAKQYGQLWSRLLKAINARNRSRLSLYIAILATPELSPLHDYTKKILVQYSNTLKISPISLVKSSISNETTVKQMMLNIAKSISGLVIEDRIFSILKEKSKLLSIRFLAKYGGEPEVQNALLCILTTNVCKDAKIHKEAVRALVPYLPNLRIEEVCLKSLIKIGPFPFRPALDKLLASSRFLTAVIMNFTDGRHGLKTLLKKHVDKTDVINELIENLSFTNQLHMIKEIVPVLGLVSDQIPVQEALCQKLMQLQRRFVPPDVLQLFSQVFSAARLDFQITAKYGRHLPILKDHIYANRIVKGIQDIKDPDEQRLQWLRALLKESNAFVEEAAAKTLAPFIVEDPRIITAFLDYICDERKPSEAGAIIVSALGRFAHREYIRKSLIQRTLDGQQGRHDDPKERLATVKALRPFFNEPEVRKAFLIRLRVECCPKVRCELIDILALQLNEPDVLNLFLEPLQNGGCLAELLLIEDIPWVVAIIDKLGKVASRPDVSRTLHELIEHSTYEVKAACIRALCVNQAKPLIKPEALLTCIGKSPKATAEAIRALQLWVQD